MKRIFSLHLRCHKKTTETVVFALAGRTLSTAASIGVGGTLFCFPLIGGSHSVGGATPFWGLGGGLGGGGAVAFNDIRTKHSFLISEIQFESPRGSRTAFLNLRGSVTPLPASAVRMAGFARALLPR